VSVIAIVVTWEGGTATQRCVASLLAQDRPLGRIVVVDNASSAAERERLATAWAAEPRVELVLLDENRQFAGGMNAGAVRALSTGAARLLFLNNDTVLAPDAVRRLGEALDATPGAGIAGPRIVDVRDETQVISAGERHRLATLCLPRMLLRYRRPLDRPYRVQGVMGCALLVSRECFQTVGGFAPELEVYYEDVDFCLGAEQAGFTVVVEPRAVVAHDGLRGFASGLTPWAAFLKARNGWLLVRRRGTWAVWPVFVPTYLAMLGASAALYTVRGRMDVVRALARGAWAGVRGAVGGRPEPVGAPRRVG
jgi:GT2 family glycosyltransferase